MIKMLHMNDPEAVVDLFTTSNKSKIKITEQLASLTTGINKITYYQLREPFHTAMFALNLMFHRKYDWGIFMYYDNSTLSSIWPYVISKFSCKKTIGTKLSYKPIVKWDIPVSINPPGQPKDFVFDNYNKILQAMGYDTSLDYVNEKFINTEPLKNLLPPFTLPNKGRPLVSLLIGLASFMTKNWPYEYWNKLIDLLLEKKINVMLLGGKDEIEKLGAHPEITSKNGIINMIGKCNVLGSMSLVNASDLVIGGDTGLIHAAWIMNVTALSLWGPSDPQGFFLRGKKNFQLIASKYECAPCAYKPEHRELACENNMCMKTITVESVFNKAMDMLNEFCPDKMKA